MENFFHEHMVLTNPKRWVLGSYKPEGSGLCTKNDCNASGLCKPTNLSALRVVKTLAIIISRVFFWGVLESLKKASKLQSPTGDCNC